MAIARAQLVDVSLTRWYHCLTRCVRRAFLLGEGDHNRKEWLENSSSCQLRIACPVSCIACPVSCIACPVSLSCQLVAGGLR
jgi:predicted transporter